MWVIIEKNPFQLKLLEKPHCTGIGYEVRSLIFTAAGGLLFRGLRANFQWEAFAVLSMLTILKDLRQQLPRLTTLGTVVISVVSSHSCSHSHKSLALWVLCHMPMLFFFHPCSRSPSDFLQYIAPKEGSALLTLTTFGCRSQCRTLYMVYHVPHPLNQAYWDHQFCFSSREQLLIFRSLNRYSLRTSQISALNWPFYWWSQKGKNIKLP